ncbi:MULTISPECIES: enoyl-CoA hydratase-related protein [Empedobacter]|uniref:2-(1,2-epoxy-1,2-dihydrophenyl)acetyl-CoA isomerase n=1 Tax=Empedobacter falsenii TaxID=343874 RepID=A0A376G5U5_9FLAO|nr:MULTISPECIES: enoyl-CoA hydratase-related protein [Empedobacter]MDH0660028.1 enoyl-CoA hydratase-related protein [Empedobacter sp. GD03865]MDH0674223.1 enoyl-CoA hydratase-related protein [Empedobacter sp. GD03861]MDH1603362.1 enoyl-CoA hydratase-related protein [Empedobacter sp. GD03739]MDM1139696.1 enoyl-CoA hydratase/isomerase family protein [Empedobacter sp. R132-2]RRT89441.1 2-(1,2-epoxy-1,2-dihydrophenyl)acetyl-CoA isomerase [Empedobacter falsenii]
MENSTSILYTQEGGIATITLNRPSVFNSFNQEMIKSLQHHLDVAAQDVSVRAVVLTGTGKAFCAGQDLGEVLEEKEIDFNKIVQENYNPLVLKIRNMDKPVVAAVNGVAAGAGANLALACDIVVAKESTNFIQAFSKIGLIPDCGGTYFLPRLIGLQKATALMMLADKVSAAQAKEIGMIYEFFADDIFDAEVAKIADKLANLPTKGLAYTKKLLNQTFNNSIEEQLIQEGLFQAKSGNTSDYQEGVDAFIEKRNPVFKGE